MSLHFPFIEDPVKDHILHFIVMSLWLPSEQFFCLIDILRVNKIVASYFVEGPLIEFAKLSYEQFQVKHFLQEYFIADVGFFQEARIIYFPHY